MKILALDVGERRIGIAISDPGEMFAFPQGIVLRGQETFVSLKKIIKDEMIGAIVVGMPVSMNGKEGPQAKATRCFVEELTAHTELPIDFQDERLSSAEAEKRMLEADLSRKDRKLNRDAIAAALILESYLQRKKNSSAS